MTYKDFEFWNKDKLWELRKEICLGNLYLNDYKNSYNIPLSKCCNFFDGFIESCWGMEEEKEDGLTTIEEIYAKYDNMDELWDYYYGIEDCFA